MNLGGPTQHVIHLSAGLGARYPTIVAFGDVDAGEADVSDQAASAGVVLRRIDGLGRRIRLLGDAVALWRLYRLMRAVRPSIVHTHTAKAGTLGRIAAMLARVPVRVHTFHGHVFRGYFSSLATRLFIGIERLLARMTTRVIAISDSQKRELVDEFRICDDDRVEVIPLGLDLGRFAEVDAGRRETFRREIAADGAAVVTIVGRLVPIKNHELFLRTAARLTRAGHDCVFVIVGGGPEEPRIRRLAGELGLEQRIRMLGWRQDVDRIYAGSDVVALTSDNEGTPVCLIEALAAGRAVVATDVGGVRDVLEHGRFGRIVPPRDPGAMAEAIAESIGEVGRGAERDGRVREVIADRYGTARLLRETAELYDTLLAESRLLASRLQT